MENSNTEVKTEKMKISCREARLILRIIPLQKRAQNMKEEEIAAIKHYLYCKTCRDPGLGEILDEKLSCQEALLVWAEHPGALWLDANPSWLISIHTLNELYAVEHVWGKYQWTDIEKGFGGENIATACQRYPCVALRTYWQNVSLSLFNDGADGVIEEVPFILRIFLKEKWPLDKLLEIQKKRMSDVLKCIQNREITVSRGHYHEIDELVREVLANFHSLQKILTDNQRTIYD